MKTKESNGEEMMLPRWRRITRLKMQNLFQYILSMGRTPENKSKKENLRDRTTEKNDEEAAESGRRVAYRERFSPLLFSRVSPSAGLPFSLTGLTPLIGLTVLALDSPLSLLNLLFWRILLLFLLYSS